MGLSFKQRILLGMLAAGLLPLLAISGYMLVRSYQAAFHDSETILETLHDISIQRVEDYFSLVRTQTSQMATSPVTLDALKEFTAAVESLDTNAVAVNEAKLRQRYEYQQEKSPGTKPEDVNGWVPTDVKTKALQHLYISTNDSPIGDKDELMYATDGSAYSAVHKKFHPIFKSFVDEFGFYDVFIVDAKSGRIVYTDFKEIDYMSNVREGALAGTELSRVIKKALELKDPHSVVMSDFLPYMPSYNDAAGFMAAPIVENGQTIGVFALQMPLTKIAEIFTFIGSMGETYDGFLIGQDMKFRSQPLKMKLKIYDDIPTGLVEKVGKVFSENFDGVTTWLGGENNKTTLIGAIEAIDLKDFKWALVVRESQDEMLKGFWEQVWVSLIVVVVVSAIVIGLGIWFAQSLSKPVMGIARNFFAGAEKVGQATSQVGEAVSSMVAASEETSAQSKVIRKNSSEASGYVSSVSTAVDELNVSINDISQSIGETNVLIDDAVQKAKKTDEVVRSLGEASKKITEVVSLINDLAEQTNLLALNAAIEAARAGDAGRGFAVVADEVKKLASNTSQATEDIKEQVSEIQTVSEQSVVALHAVVEAIHKIRDNATTVSAAVEEQSGVAKQISGSVRDAANRVQQVDENMNGIEQAANDTSVAADQVNGSSQEVQGAFNEMKTGMQKVLDQMGIKA